MLDDDNLLLRLDEARERLIEADLRYLREMMIILRRLNERLNENIAIVAHALLLAE